MSDDDMKLNRYMEAVKKLKELKRLENKRNYGERKDMMKKYYEEDREARLKYAKLRYYTNREDILKKAKERRESKLIEKKVSDMKLSN